MNAPFNLDAMCAAATQRLRQTLNRSVAQHRAHIARRAAALAKGQA